jgi:hypothetical protein
VHDTTAAEAEAVVISQVPLAPEETAAPGSTEGKVGEE